MSQSRQIAVKVSEQTSNGSLNALRVAFAREGKVALVG